MVGLKRNVGPFLTMSICGASMNKQRNISRFVRSPVREQTGGATNVFLSFTPWELCQKLRHRLRLVHTTGQLLRHEPSAELLV